MTARLVAIRGLGEWTADWFLARHLARPHAWPAGDLGLRKAVSAFYGDVPDLRAFADRFDPFENLTAHYLLTGLGSCRPHDDPSRDRGRLGRLRALWDRWQSEIPPHRRGPTSSWEANQAEFEQALDANALFSRRRTGADRVRRRLARGHFARIGDLYVVDAGRRQGPGVRWSRQWSRPARPRATLLSPERESAGASFYESWASARSCAT